VSVQVRWLESVLGQQLLDRLGQLTGAWTAVLPFAAIAHARSAVTRPRSWDQDPRRCQRTRQPAGQACLIGQVPQQHQPGVRHDTLTAAGYFEAPLWVAFCL